VVSLGGLPAGVSAEPQVLTHQSLWEWAGQHGWPTSPLDRSQSIQVIRSWHVNDVHVRLNEDCWLGIDGVPRAYGGAKSRERVVAYMHSLTANGVYPILDLHWSPPGVAFATSPRQMRDDLPVAFWRSVATVFVNNPDVMPGGVQHTRIMHSEGSDRTLASGAGCWPGACLHDCMCANNGRRDTFAQLGPGATGGSKPVG
jgi:hypothetical protein